MSAVVMHDSAQQYDELSDAESESQWGWNAVKNWWNPSSNKGYKLAESNLANAYLDETIYHWESKEIPIAYDPEPMSSKQRKHKPSGAFALFSSSSDTRSADTEPQYIHTLSICIKSDKLQSFIADKNTKHVIHSEDSDDDGAYDENELKNDGAAIEGQSMSKFFQRKMSQKGSSTYRTLQKQLETYTNNRAKQERIAPIVLTHGYGCASGYFIPSVPVIYDTILRSMNVAQSPVIHLIDWLGNGLSSRPQFQCETTQEAEDFFVESLEAWRQKMNIDKMILSGHSLGAYINAIYAMKYPQHIEHLVLISPVGVPQRPNNADAALLKYSWKVRTMFKTFRKFWDAGWTPHDIVRLTGPQGKALIQKLVQRRLFRVDDNDPLKPLLAEYLYQAIGREGSGEYALNKILQSGAWAHHPLAVRIGILKRFQHDVNGYDAAEENEESKEDQDSDCDIDADKVLNDNLKIDFIYGETDWMTSGHAVKLKQKGVIKCNVYVNPQCGHQLIVENAKGFAQLFGGIVAKGQILSHS